MTTKRQADKPTEPAPPEGPHHQATISAQVLRDLSYLQVLQAHHPRAVAISAATKRGLDDLRDAVVAALSANFTRATVAFDQANGKVLAYLSAHAEIERQEYDGNRVTVRCLLPRPLFHHIIGPGVTVRFLDEPEPPAEDE